MQELFIIKRKYYIKQDNTTQQKQTLAKLPENEERASTLNQELYFLIIDILFDKTADT